MTAILISLCWVRTLGCTLLALSVNLDLEFKFPGLSRPTQRTVSLGPRACGMKVRYTKWKAKDINDVSCTRRVYSCGGFPVFMKKTSEVSDLCKLLPSDPPHLRVCVCVCVCVILARSLSH